MVVLGLVIKGSGIYLRRLSKRQIMKVIVVMIFQDIIVITSIACLFEFNSLVSITFELDTRLNRLNIILLGSLNRLLRVTLLISRFTLLLILAWNILIIVLIKEQWSSISCCIFISMNGSRGRPRWNMLHDDIICCIVLTKKLMLLCAIWKTAWLTFSRSKSAHKKSRTFSSLC